jgi:hypothetical protein
MEGGGVVGKEGLGWAVGRICQPCPGNPDVVMKCHVFYVMSTLSSLLPGFVGMAGLCCGRLGYLFEGECSTASAFFTLPF